MSIEDTELLAEFVIESQEHLENVESQLLTLEAQPDNVDAALVNNVFRAVHSIKGAAGFLGLQTLEALAHREEEVLNRLRNLEMRPTSVVVNTLLAATDRLKGLLADIDNSNEQDVSDHVTALEALLQNASAPEPITSTAPPAQPVAASQADEPLLQEGSPPPRPQAGAAAPAQEPAFSSEAIREFIIESCDALEQIERDLVSLESSPSDADLINVIFRNIHTIKGSAGFLAFNNLERLAHACENVLGRMRGGELELDSSIGNLLFATVDALRKYLLSIEHQSAEGPSHSDSLVLQLNSVQDRPRAAATTEPAAASGGQPAVPPTAPQPVSTTQSPSAETAAKQTPPASSPATENNLSSAAETTIRVDVALLDKLMTRVGELVLARNQIVQFTGILGDSELLSASQRLNLITTELQEGVMKTRMQPIGTVWSKFPRIVRDLANACGKEVRMEMEGKATELDKTIIEAIKDPLTHLVRNSVDHGIEKPELRHSRGKPREGCLLLRAFHEGGQVIIEISDDGAGLNPEKIKAKALEKGLINKDQADVMADHDVAQLIFLPGFSTADKVSNVSGRGVGMDVVKTNIEKIGGVVDIQSQLGQGTVIKIKIPLTLAIIPALVVTNNGSRFAIPQANLLELVRLEGEQAKVSIEWIQGAPVYRLRGNLLPLVYMRTILQSDQPNSPPTEPINIVVLRADEGQFGLVVDRINDTEEIVVKPLSKQLMQNPVFSGATIMGDGKVALILDVLGLAHASRVISKERNRELLEGSLPSQTATGKQQTLLILETANKQRMALPISQVARLEKIEKRLVERADNQELVQYRNEILPLIRLANVLGLEAQEVCNDTHLTVVVYNEQSRSVGLVVHRIIDIVDTALEISCPSKRAGLLATAVIQDRMTNVVDLPAMIKQVDVFRADSGECVSAGRN